jgi:hypothetical protein
MLGSSCFIYVCELPVMALRVTMNKVEMIFRQLVLSLTVAVLMATLFRTIYMDGETCNYFLAWILIGFPFGIGKMCLWLVPTHYDLAGTIGIVFLNVLVGGMIGGLVLIWQILKGLSCIVSIILRRN